MARVPPAWLWFNEEVQAWSWPRDKDLPLDRDLTLDELFIKAHFDRIMARADPSYIDGAYRRGLWVRKLAMFAIHGINTSGNFWEHQEQLVKEWAEHYNDFIRASKERSDENESDDDDDIDSDGFDSDGLDDPSDDEDVAQTIHENWSSATIVIGRPYAQKFREYEVQIRQPQKYR